MRLGNLELLIRLASGGAANVFLVRDLNAPDPGRLLALKILLPSLAQNDDFLKMFFTEAQLAGQLRHDHVVAIAGFGKVEGIYCLAMEYVFGASLAQVLRASARAKKPLTVGVLLSITASVCDALHYAHELRDERGKPMGIVHRDVTPQNILIGFNGSPKLTDFGIAKATNRGWETQAGIVKGKFSYMSPEQALGKKVDRRSDIFGTGIVLWEALTGRDLFKGSTPMEVLTAIREQKIEPPSKVVPGLTPIVDPIVMKALRRSPRARYQTAASMRDEILNLIKRAGVEINAETISKEFAAIYGEVIMERALKLRAAMAGKADVEGLAKALGGQLLNDTHLPELQGGENDPDPLGLFEQPDMPFQEPQQASAFVMPARTEAPFTQEQPGFFSDDFEIVEDDGGMADLAKMEPEIPNANQSAVEVPELIPYVPNERAVQGWEDNTSMGMHLPDDELLSMISEEDATIGYLPPAFAERFGQDLKAALEEEESGFEEEATVGITDEQLADLRALRNDDSQRAYTRSPGSSHSIRPIPRAPSLDMEAKYSSSRPVPRAPSLDMESLAPTPRPMLEDEPRPSARPPPRPPPPPPLPFDEEDSGMELPPRRIASGTEESGPSIPPVRAQATDGTTDEEDSLDPLKEMALIPHEPPPSLQPENGLNEGEAAPLSEGLSPDALRALVDDPAPSGFDSHHASVPAQNATGTNGHSQIPAPSATGAGPLPIGPPGLQQPPHPMSMAQQAPPKGGIRLGVGTLMLMIFALLAAGTAIGFLLANR